MPRCSFLVTEPLAVCGKWKALTAQYAREVACGVDVSLRVDMLTQHLVVVLFLFGATGSLDDLRQAAGEAFRERLTDALSSAVMLQRATKEDVLSADFQLIIPCYGDTFVDEIMEDVNARPKRRSRKASGRGQQPVLCTTDLGLMRTERRSEVAGNNWETESVVMLKSRVALMSIYADLNQ